MLFKNNFSILTLQLHWAKTVFLSTFCNMLTMKFIKFKDVSQNYIKSLKIFK